MSAREDVMRSVVGFERGDDDDPDDTGGLTHYGLTFEVFREERPRGTVEDLLALTRDQVIDILTARYAVRPGLDRVADPALRWAVIDFAINSGVGTATRALQRAAGVQPVDGVFGPHTAAAVAAADPARLFRRLMAARVRFLAQIIRTRRSQAKFVGGWFDRVATILEA